MNPGSPDRNRTGERQGLALALASAAAFGTNIVSAQIAGQAGLSGPLLVFYRVLLMLVLVGGGALVWRGSLVLRRGERQPVLLFGLMTALVGIAYLSSVAFVPVSVAAVVFYTFPVLIVLAEPVFTPAPFEPTGSRSCSQPFSVSPSSSALIFTDLIHAALRSRC